MQSSNYSFFQRDVQAFSHESKVSGELHINLC